jgi:hypothetical protein
MAPVLPGQTAELRFGSFFDPCSAQNPFRDPLFARNSEHSGAFLIYLISIEGRNLIAHEHQNIFRFTRNDAIDTLFRKRSTSLF